MNKTIVLISALSAAVGAAPSGTHAQTYNDQFRQKTSSKIGFYVRIPFAGRTQSSSNTSMRYGLAFSLENNIAQNSYWPNARQNYSAELSTIDFSLNGSKQLTLGGYDVVHSRPLPLGENETVFTPKNIMLGVLAASAIVVGVIIVSGGDKDPCGFYSSQFNVRGSVKLEIEATQVIRPKCSPRPSPPPAS